MQDDLEKGATARPGEPLPDAETEELYWENEEGERDSAEPGFELLSFTVGKEEYALNVHEVREIIKRQHITIIPRCPGYILGIISLRGEIVPVIDLCRRLGLGRTESADESMIIIVSLNAEPAGLLVESIQGILVVKEEEIEITPDVVSPEKAEFFRGVIRARERLSTILNLDHLLEVSADFKAMESRRGGPGESPNRL
jgi:purine-binding chemotaxis protein CheW